VTRGRISSYSAAITACDFAQPTGDRRWRSAGAWGQTEFQVNLKLGLTPRRDPRSDPAAGPRGGPTPRRPTLGLTPRRRRPRGGELEGLPGTFDQITLILDSPNVQGMWTNRLSGIVPNRSLGQWEEMKEMRFKRFANYFPQNRN
jgi:hypothetical protein